MHIMGLEDRVIQVRAEFGRQTGLEDHENVHFGNSVYQGDFPVWKSHEKIPKPEIDRVLDHFGVESKLELIRKKYWGCGELFRLRGGYRLYTSYREHGGYETITHPAKAGHSYVTHDGMPEKGSGYMRYVSTPGTPEYTEQRPYDRDVRHAIVAIVGELKTQGSSDQEQGNLALFVAIGINPMSYVLGSNPSYNEEASAYLDQYYIQTAIRKLGSGKYTPGTSGVFHPNRDYVIKPFAPWDIFVKDSKPSELDDFLAEYVVDADLDQKSIRLTSDEAHIKRNELRGLPSDLTILWRIRGSEELAGAGEGQAAAAAGIDIETQRQSDESRNLAEILLDLMRSEAIQQLSPGEVLNRLRNPKRHRGETAQSFQDRRDILRYILPDEESIAAFIAKQMNSGRRDIINTSLLVEVGPEIRTKIFGHLTNPELRKVVFRQLRDRVQNISAEPTAYADPDQLARSLEEWIANSDACVATEPGTTAAAKRTPVVAAEEASAEAAEGKAYQEET